MAFRTYTNLGEVVNAFDLRLIATATDFPVLEIAAPDLFKQELTLTLDNLPFAVSEAALCDNIIYPILREVWKQFAQTFMVWSHQPIVLNEELNGVPDYMFTRQSPRGRTILDAPYVAVIEAKRDDFTMGWAQCALEMYTMQQLNQDTRPVYGVVTNGRLWEFGVLADITITQYVEGYSIREIDKVFGALTYVLETCKRIYNL
jgi:hypothetical protein